MNGNAIWQLANFPTTGTPITAQPWNLKLADCPAPLFRSYNIADAAMLFGESWPAHPGAKQKYHHDVEVWEKAALGCNAHHASPINAMGRRPNESEKGRPRRKNSPSKNGLLFLSGNRTDVLNSLAIPPIRGPKHQSDSVVQE
ncbi:MAG: hypothetical protein Ct9H300mP11_29780 [Chloroflexota bacterium]|nr:MAG: hypothetical protein Ct9H300mP11_29780 [Chloroflexota bacterium]